MKVSGGETVEKLGGKPAIEGAAICSSIMLGVVDCAKQYIAVGLSVSAVLISIGLCGLPLCYARVKS